MEGVESPKNFFLRLLGKLKIAPSATFVRSVAILAGGTALGRILVALASPFLTRLYTPEDMGRLGAFVAFVGFASVAPCLRYETAIVSAQTVQESAYLALASLGFVVPVSLICSLVFYSLIRFSILGYQVLPVSSALWVFLVLILAGAFLALRFWFIREGRFTVVSRVFVLQNGVRVAAQVGFGVLRAGWMGLLWGELLGRVFGLSQMVKQSLPAIRSQVSPFNLRAMWNVLVAYRKFPLYSLPSSLLDNLASSLVLPLIVQFYGTGDAGHFSLAQLVFALPLSLVGGSVADVFVSRMAIYARSDPHQARPFFLKTAAGLLGAGLVPSVGIALVGPTLFKVVFGTAWFEAGLLAAAMAPLSLAQIVVSPLSQVVFVFQGQEFKLVYDVARLLAIGTLIFGHAQGLPVVESIRWWSLAEVLLYVLYFFLLLRIVNRPR